MDKVLGFTVPLAIVAVIVLAAIGIEWASGGWVPGWLAIGLFIVSPLIVDVALGLVGKSNEAIAFLIFPSFGFGVPALFVYLAMMVARAFI